MKKILLVTFLTLLNAHTSFALTCSSCIEDRGSTPPTAYYEVYNGGHDDLIDIVMTADLQDCLLRRSQDLRCQ